MKLFIYEHCPFCTRVRIISSQLEVTNVYLAYDDIVGHTRYIFKKQVPFLQKEDGQFMTESMQICKYLNSLKKDKILSDRSQLINYDQEITKLTMDAYNISQPLLWIAMREHPLNSKTFPTKSAKDLYTEKNANSPSKLVHNIAASYIQNTIKTLEELFALNKENYFDKPEVQLSWHDVDIFPWLRNLTILDESSINLGLYTKKYLNRISSLTNIPLYD